MLARVDADGMPAYLESSSERNLALYGRHGFEITSEVAIPAGRGSGPCGASPELEPVITAFLVVTRTMAPAAALPGKGVAAPSSGRR
jgi:hypothetical protein